MGAESITPWGAAASGAQTLLGLGQMIFSGKKKAEKNLENFANTYQPNSSILDYYNKALAKYSPNPYTSQSFQNRTNLIGRNLASGINATQDRHGALSTINSLVTSANDANANVASNAEAQQTSNLSQLGSAAGAKAGEDSKKFDLKYNLLAMKASGANATQAAGIKNAFGGLQSGADLMFGNQLYGDGGDIRKYRGRKAVGGGGSEFG